MSPGLFLVSFMKAELNAGRPLPWQKPAPMTRKIFQGIPET